MKQDVEELDEYGCPQFQHIVGPRAERQVSFGRFSFSDTKLHCIFCKSVVHFGLLLEKSPFKSSWQLKKFRGIFLAHFTLAKIMNKKQISQEIASLYP